MFSEPNGDDGEGLDSRASQAARVPRPGVLVCIWGGGLVFLLISGFAFAGISELAGKDIFPHFGGKGNFLSLPFCFVVN